MRWLLYTVIALVAVAAAVYAAFVFSPWPSVLLIRYAFDKDSTARNVALAKHVPAGVTATTGVRYGEGGSQLLDVLRPAGATGPLPMVVWIHGGAFIAGNREDVAEYLKVLAARGYVTVGVGYTTAPSARYPTPVIEANRALGFLVENAGRFGIDPARIFVAGDSAGGQIAAQLAATIAGPGYAAEVGVTPAIPPESLRGAILFCGIYDPSTMSFEGPFGAFLRTAVWSYFGTTDTSGPQFAQFAVAGHLTPAFPPAFVSVGNADPLGAQSVLIAEAIAAQGVPVDTLFFPADYVPPLAHEYQFNLDTEAGKQAFDRLSAFLAARSG